MWNTGSTTPSNADKQANGVHDRASTARGSQHENCRNRDIYLLPSYVRIRKYIPFLKACEIADKIQTFFSTDVVKYQGGGGSDKPSESFSLLALQRWFEVTIPLTVITFALAGTWLYWYVVKEWTIWIFKKVLPRHKGQGGKRLPGP
jgi:hypothetical protein